MKNKMYFLVIILIAITLRLYNINNENVWYDESITYYNIFNSHNVTNFLENCRNTDPNINLGYFVPVWYFSEIFGKDVFTIRMFSVLLGVLTLLIVYMISKEYTTNERSLVVLFLTSISLTHIYYSQEIRMYSMLLFISSSCILFTVRLVKYNKFLDMILLSLTCCILIWVHMLSIILVIICSSIVAIHYIRNLSYLILYSLPQVFNVVIYWIFWGSTISYNELNNASGWKYKVVWDYNSFVSSIVSCISGTVYKEYMFGNILYYTTVVVCVYCILKICFQVTLSKLLNKYLRTNHYNEQYLQYLLLILLALTPVVCFVFSKTVYPFWNIRYTIYTSFAYIILIVCKSNRKVLIAIVMLFIAQYMSFAIENKSFRPRWDLITNSINDGRPVLIAPKFESYTIKPLVVSKDIYPFQKDTIENDIKYFHTKDYAWLIKCNNDKTFNKIMNKYLLKKGFVPCFYKTYDGNCSDVIEVWKVIKVK